jgi:hypothetical protein
MSHWPICMRCQFCLLCHRSDADLISWLYELWPQFHRSLTLLACCCTHSVLWPFLNQLCLVGIFKNFVSLNCLCSEAYRIFLLQIFLVCKEPDVCPLLKLRHCDETGNTRPLHSWLWHMNMSHHVATCSIVHSYAFHPLTLIGSAVGSVQLNSRSFSSFLILQLSHDQFLPNTFWFIIYQSSYHLAPYEILAAL